MPSIRSGQKQKTIREMVVPIDLRQCGRVGGLTVVAASPSFSSDHNYPKDADAAPKCQAYNSACNLT
jgi:hypothetical protein